MANHFLRKAAATITLIFIGYLEDFDLFSQQIVRLRKVFFCDRLYGDGGTRILQNRQVLPKGGLSLMSLYNNTRWWIDVIVICGVVFKTMKYYSIKIEG
jgi:hypothetical protein